MFLKSGFSYYMAGQQNYHRFSYLIVGGVLTVGLYFGNAGAQIEPRLDGPRIGIESLLNYQEENTGVVEGRRERRRATSEQLRRMHRRRYPLLNKNAQEISYELLGTQRRVYHSTFQNRYK